MSNISKAKIISNILNSYLPVIEKADTDITGKIKNDPNYYPMVISYRMKNGTLVRKREYVKNTDIHEIKYSVRQQKALEDREEKGESLIGQQVKVKWRGDSSITPYQTEDAEIAGSDGANFTIKLTKPFNTMNSENFVYPVGHLLTIPKTSNPEWMKDQAKVKVQEVGTPDKPGEKDIEEIDKELGNQQEQNQTQQPAQAPPQQEVKQ